MEFSQIMDDPLVAGATVVGGIAVLSGATLMMCARSGNQESNDTPKSPEPEKKKKKQSQRDSRGQNAAQAPSAAKAEPSNSNESKKPKKKSKKASKEEPKKAEPPQKQPEPKKESKHEQQPPSQLEEKPAEQPADGDNSNSKKKKKKKSKNKGQSEAAPERQKTEQEDDGWEQVVAPKKKSKKQSKQKPLSVESKQSSVEATKPTEPVATEQKQQAPAESPVVPETPSKQFSIDPRKVGIIIGPQGTTLKRIEELSGCRVQVGGENEDGPQNTTPVRVEGPPEAIPIAAKAILQLASKGYSALLQGEDFRENSILVHPGYFVDLIGPKGAVVNALRDTLSVHLTIPPSPKDMSEAVPLRVGIAGPKDGVEKAKQVIESIMMYYHHEITHPGLVHVEYLIPEEHVPRFIGGRGANIRHIQGDSRAKVHMPREYSKNKHVVVVGHQQQVEIAKKHIARMLQAFKEQDELHANGERDAADPEEEEMEDWMKQYMYQRR